MSNNYLNVIIPKIRTVFGQQCPQFKFVKFCCDHNLNVNNFKFLKVIKIMLILCFCNFSCFSFI